MRALVLPLLALSLAAPAHAQPAAPAPGLRARMAEFLRVLPRERGQDTTRRFFPRTGDWTYTHTVHLPGKGVRIQRWTFPAEVTSRFFGFGEGASVDPIRESFEINYEGQTVGLLLETIMRSSRPWKWAGGTRFVPPRARASCPVFVEWRREGRGWVISHFGDESWEEPPLAGYELGDVLRVHRGGPEPAQPAYAAGEAWFEAGEPISFEGYRYVKYGQVRTIEARDLAPVGWRGEVWVYAEPAATCSPQVIYVATAPASYQPYIAYSRRPRHCPGAPR